MRQFVVTGAASGIGKAIAERLVERGLSVIGVDIANADICADLASPEGIASMTGEVDDRTNGSLNGVAACAGLSPPHEPVEVMRVNYFGATGTLAALRPLLAKGSDPRAVAISSEAIILERNEAITAACLSGDRESAVAATRAAPEYAYQSSKAALSLWIRREAVTKDWAGAGIVLNGVAPGVTRTPMIQHLLDTEEGRALLDEATPSALGRPAEPTEVAELVVHLLSPSNSVVIGQTIFCDMGADAIRRPAHV